MKRLSLVLIYLVLVCAFGAVAVSRATSPGRVYSVAELRAGLARDPAAWLGRTVLVRGTVVGSCPSTSSCVWSGPPQLVDADRGRTGLLLVTWGPEDALLGFIRHLPLVGRVAPARQQVAWGQQKVYRVALQSEPNRALCPIHSCYQIVLLDVKPSAPVALPVPSLRAWTVRGAAVRPLPVPLRSRLVTIWTGPGPHGAATPLPEQPGASS